MYNKNRNEVNSSWKLIRYTILAHVLCWRVDCQSRTDVIVINMCERMYLDEKKCHRRRIYLFIHPWLGYMVNTRKRTEKIGSTKKCKSQNNYQKVDKRIAQRAALFIKLSA